MCVCDVCDSVQWIMMTVCVEEYECGVWDTVCVSVGGCVCVRVDICTRVRDHAQTFIGGCTS